MTTPAAPKLVIRDLRKSFALPAGERVVLRDIALDVYPGEFICIVGPSGCGKSTLLNILGGFDRQTSGIVRIDGEPVLRPDPRRIFVFQDYGLFPWATVWDNVALGLRRHPAKERKEIIQRCISLVGLTGFEESYPRELSGGMKQRVAIARALAVSPDVIYMDEPLGALDSLTRLQMRAELLRVWQAEKMTVLLVTHDVDEALQLADRVFVMSGRPGTILETVPVNMSHPRDPGSSRHLELKRHILGRLGVDMQV